MKSVRTYQRENKRLRNLLASIEWIQPTYNGAPSCPCCGAMQHWKHEPDCELAATVKSPLIREKSAPQHF